jgi:hypothetical protein
MTRLFCYIGFHRYASKWNDRGERYFECTRCNKFKDATGPGAGAGGIGSPPRVVAPCRFIRAGRFRCVWEMGTPGIGAARPGSGRGSSRPSRDTGPTGQAVAAGRPI